MTTTETETSIIAKSEERYLIKGWGEPYFRINAQGHVEVRPDPAPTLWNLLADRSMLEKAVISLVASSAEALEGRGVIRLRTANQDFPPSPKGPPAGRWVCLSVQDDGPVIPRDSLSRVFEPFSAVRGPNKKKEGLRLATAYGIARQTGGHLSVSSHPASGTSFDLLLPMTEDEAARPLPGTRAATGAGGETVLVVEPDPSMRSLLARMLSSLGYRVLSAAKESEALDAARESTTPVALLLSGMELPSWSGPELLDKLRAGGSACQALFTSGAGGESSSREAFGVKPEHVLVKPFSQEELAGRIREVLDRVPIPSA